jgi:tetratricopeptide (TPR) repeat protein
LGDYDGAINDQTLALKLRPDFVEALSDRGATRQIKGDLDGARADYEQAIRFNPRFADVWFNRAVWWLAQADWVRAAADFTHYITLDTVPKPQLADAYAQRGLVRLQQGRPEEAQQDFDQCLKLNPGLRKSLEHMVDKVKQQVSRNP